MTEHQTPWQRRGSYALSDLTDPFVVVICTRCARRDRYNVARLIAVHGDKTAPDLLALLRDQGCEGRDSWGGCGLTFEAPPGGPVSRASRPVSGGR